MAQVPVEIFEIITSYLTRAEVRNLRLVCREFETKVSAQYFRNVVVPFRSELYSDLSLDENGSVKHSASKLFSNGMHIFECFGPHILRFALSLELDEDSLAYPPVKPIQEAVPAFWGIYRWPHANYHRYTDLEGLEQTADETEGMKSALRCLTKVRNIGLCCDAGLGFLLGPDKIARKANVQHPVFSTVDWRRNERSSQSAHQPSITVADFNDVARDHHRTLFPNPMAFRKNILEKMAMDAGYSGNQIPEAVRIMLETEGTNLTNINFDERSSFFASNSDGLLRHLVSSLNSFRDATNCPLIPADLTRAQREMLLELEWAHRAMVQSYIIGLIDNSSIGCFSNVTTFTIAKIPGSHVQLFCRHDLWEGIPSLKNVSIGVIADWRKVMVSSPGFVEDAGVSPIESTGKVFTLLNMYIAQCQNIESVHFEWICGGEFAPSVYQRNSYILPAPIVNRSELMADPTTIRDDTSGLLQLPYVKHLSLKNCWSSPHIFLQCIRKFALSSLEKLELESVSLSGPPTTTRQALLVQVTVTLPMHGIAAAPMGDHLDHYAPPPPDVMMNPHLPQQTFPTNIPSDDGVPSVDGLRQPDLLTWAGLIDHLSPSVKIRQLLAEHFDHDIISTTLAEKTDHVINHIPCAAGLHDDEKKYKLKFMTFKSCGYVSVNTPYLKSRDVLPVPYNGHTVIHTGSHDIMSLMQFSNDPLLAKTTQYIKDQERAVLVNAFGMTMGWVNIYDAHVIADARADGVQSPGSGRFSGAIK